MVSRRCVLLAALAFVASAVTVLAEDPIACAKSCSATLNTCQSKCRPDDLSCLNDCAQTYSFECVPQCQPTPAKCVNACSLAYSQCESSCQDFDCPNICTSGYNSCTQACPSTIKAEVTAPSTRERVGADSPCTDECADTLRSCSQACTSFECSITCTQTYYSCKLGCNPAQAQCMSSLLQCNGACSSTYQQCLASNGGNTCWDASIKCQGACSQTYVQCRDAPAPVIESATPVEGVRECVKECKHKEKDAAAKCKHEKFAKRAACYAQVPNMAKACQTGCTRKPLGVTALPSIDPACVVKCASTNSACHTGCPAITGSAQEAACHDACERTFGEVCLPACGGDMMTAGAKVGPTTRPLLGDY